MSGRFIEDYEVGETLVSGTYTLTRESLVRFASEYDPQPMHIDEEFARGAGPFGDVIASGFQTVAIAFKLFVETGVFDGDVALGGPGMSDVRWLKPVFAGDVLVNHATILEARRSTSKPDRGLIRVQHTLHNQSGETVVTCVTVSMIRCREPGNRGT
jgi:acyl dehydratase